MKKHLVWLLALLSMIAILVACTAGPEETTTPEDSSDVVTPWTDPVTEPVTDPSSETHTDTQPVTEPEDETLPESETEIETLPETETETEEVLEIDGFRMDHERIERQFNSANAMKATRVELEGEGAVVKLCSTGATQDPFIFFNAGNYCTVKKLGKLKADNYRYVILRVKVENCSSAKFELFYCAGSVTGATGECVLQSSFDNASEEWQYIVFDMSGAGKWTGNINGFRFDYQLSAAAADEIMYVSHMYFAKDDEEMRLITQKGIKNPFEVVTDPVVEAKVDELLATPDAAPTPDNTKKKAAHEDEGLELWFNHAYINNPAEDVTSTGMNTYQLRLAKNEAEGAHMFLLSKGGHQGLTVSVTPFRNAKGDQLKTELMYGYYFEDVDGKTLVDPIPWVREGQTFDLTQGRSYMYIIKATSAVDTPAGSYTAVVTVKDAQGQEIKRAEISAYVWNFTLPEETSCKTQMDLSWYNIYFSHECWDGDDSRLYKNYYDLLLANRVCAYTLPYSKEGQFSDPRILEYLNNPRVTAFNPLGWKVEANETNVTAAYAFLSQKQEWLDKAYFYLVDEPGSKAQLDRVNAYGDLLKRCFPGYKMMAPEHVNYVLDKDSTMDNFAYVQDSINVWCFKPYFFTTYEQYKYDRRLTYWMTPKLEANLGSFAERMNAEKEGGDELWWYVTRRPESPEITLLMETEAIRHRILFWQQKLYNVDSFLYYLANDWYEIGENNGLNKKHETAAGFDAYDCYGNGVLLYCGQDFDVYGGVESIRLESVRDGIEDFEYLTMLAELYGKDVTDALIRRLTTSLSQYNTDTDHFTELRITLGNCIEAALNGQAGN